MGRHQKFNAFWGCLALLGILSGASAAQDEGPAPFPQFEAKRVKPPKSGTRKRINVQIAPNAAAPNASTSAAAPSAGGETAVAPARYTARYDWFWQDIAPELAASGPGRLEPALTALQTAAAPVASPRLQALQDIAAERGVDLLTSTIGTNVSPALALAVIAVESGGRADAVSSAGAQGLMQLMPATATRFKVSDALEPSDNIKGGIAYLDWLMGEFKSDPILVLAAYNAGEGAVRQHQGVPPYPETRDYVPKVLAAFATARGLCKTPPQLISDGCVFRVMK